MPDNRYFEGSVIHAPGGTGAPFSTDVVTLRAELDDLRRAMSSAATVEQAKGMLMERLACSVDEAGTLLELQSRHGGATVYDTAAGYVRAGSATALPVQGLRYLLAQSRDRAGSEDPPQAS